MAPLLNLWMRSFKYPLVFNGEHWVLAPRRDSHQYFHRYKKITADIKLDLMVIIRKVATGINVKVRTNDTQFAKIHENDLIWNPPHPAYQRTPYV